MNINLDTAKDTLCKNILIYGYCKYENKGCVFSHNRKPPSSAGNSAPKPPTNAQGTNAPALGSTSNPNYQSSAAPNFAPDSKRKFNFNTPSFQPSGVQNVTNKFAALSPRLNDIPVFVPGSGGSTSSTPNASAPTSASSMQHAQQIGASNEKSEVLTKKFNVSTPIFTPSNPFPVDGYQDSTGSASISSQPNGGGSGPNYPYMTGGNGVVQTPGASEVFFQQQNTTYPLQYHLYAPAPPPRMTFPLPPHETNAISMFIPNDLRETLQKKNEATLQTIPRSNLPDHINEYHSLVPIDKSYEPNSEVWGIPTSLYKVFSNTDGNAYALRKIDHKFVISNEMPFRSVKKWKTLKNANVVQLYEAFTTMAFGKSQLIIAYDYYPNSNTLVEHHKKIGGRTEPITEDILWNYLIQLVNALVAIHEKGLAARSSLTLSKIIVTNKNRIRLSGCGVSDILNFEKDEEEINTKGGQNFLNELQREDITNLGKVMLELSLMTVSHSLRNSNNDKLQSIGLLKTASTINFSNQYLEVLTKLNEESQYFDLPKFRQLYLTNKAFKVLNDLQDTNDFFESQLSTELENARLFRLMAKLNFIIDRPDIKDWNENGNKYVIKLFRDFIFYHHDDYGKPIVDLSRVLVNLNKLDSGIDEKIILVSQDEKNCIIVSYKEIRDMVDSIFRTLTRG